MTSISISLPAAVNEDCTIWIRASSSSSVHLLTLSKQKVFSRHTLCCHFLCLSFSFTCFGWITIVFCFYLFSIWVFTPKTLAVVITTFHTLKTLAPFFEVITRGDIGFFFSCALTTTTRFRIGSYAAD